MINKNGEIVKIVKIQHFPHVFLQYLRYFSFQQNFSRLAEQVAAGQTSTQFEAAGVIPGPGCHFPRGPAGNTRRKFRDLTGNPTQVSRWSVVNCVRMGKR